jgi:hypothetical protein
MQITPTTTEANGIVSVQLAAAFIGGQNDAVDKANILAFGDPLVNLSGGLFVDNSTGKATLQRQDLTFTATTVGSAGNAVTIQFIAVGAADASAIQTTGNAITVDVLPAVGSPRTTAQIKTLFDSFPPTTTGGGVIYSSRWIRCNCYSWRSFQPCRWRSSDCLLIQFPR